MNLRFLVALALIPLTGCLATTTYRRDQLYAAPLRGDSGELTVVEQGGDCSTFHAPFEARARAGSLEVDRKLLPSARFELTKVSQVEVSEPSPGRSVLLAVGVASALGFTVAVIAAVVSSRALEPNLNLGLSGLGNSPLGY